MAAMAALVFVAVLSSVPFWPRRSASILAYRGMDGSVPVAAGSLVQASDSEPSLLRFSDESKVVLEPRARVDVVTLGDRAAQLALERGRVRVSVTPHRGAHYRIGAGPFDVQITGTEFHLSWDPSSDRFELALYEGHVVLSGCVFGAGFDVTAGKRVEASCNDRRMNVEPITADTRSDAAPPVPSARIAEEKIAEEPSIPPMGARSAPEKATPTWSELARNAQRRKAWARIETEGVENVIRRSAPTELMLLGDTARDVGELALARRVYQLVRSREPASHTAAFAAFALGRMEFDDRGAHREAAEWFRVYLREEPRGHLAREARGRLMEALQRAGNASAARQVAEEYLRLHPHGPHATLAEQLARVQP
jgi:hypothetical protein